MERYIDANKICYMWQYDADGEEHDGVTLQSIIDKMPTVDAVEVVRCKDCKHNVANWKHDDLDATDYTDIVCDYFMTDGMEPDDYCSRGEKIEREV